MRRTVIALAALLALAACGTDDGTRAEDPAAQPTGMPTAVPAADGPVTTDGLVTVLDDGDGPELCTFVAESYPPQCSGLPMRGWSWAAHPEHEDQSGTRWGSFALTGTFDGTTFTVTDAIPAASYDTVAEPVSHEFDTACPEPAGGWRVVDPTAVTQESMDATFTAAARLPGYAGAWIDASPGSSDRPAAGEAEVPDPEKLVINVAVTQDAGRAEDTLRETWGGALCVSEAAYTEAELNKIAMELQEKLPGVTTSSAADDVVQIGVVHDDGSLQAWADETYGAGRVEITSTLVPVG